MEMAAIRRISVLFLLISVLSACSPRVINSGIRGEVLIGPMCPVIQEGVPCPDQPYQASLTVLTLNGRKVLRIETDEAGRFKGLLPPGDYILHPESPEGQSLPYAADIPFTVFANEFTTVNVFFDSGIR